MKVGILKGDNLKKKRNLKKKQVLFMRTRIYTGNVSQDETVIGGNPLTAFFLNCNLYTKALSPPVQPFFLVLLLLF